MIPSYCKIDDYVYFIPYTTDTPQIKLGRLTDDYDGKLFIAYDDSLCDDGEWFICKKEEVEKTETKIKIFNLLQLIKQAKEGGE